MKELKMTLVFGIIAIFAEVLVRSLVTYKVYFDWEKLPGFYALFGFVGYVILSKFSKFLGKLLMRSPDYYERRYKR